MPRFGLDINNLGAGEGARGSINIPTTMFDAVIEDIIINEASGEILQYNQDGSNIGEALVRILPDDWGLDKKELKSAYPLEMNIQQFPNVGEQVRVFSSFGTWFYTKPLSTKQKLTENTSTILSDTFGPNKANTEDSRDSRLLSTQGVSINVTNTTRTSQEKQAKVNPNTRPLRANQGDLIFSGRFGNFIRMGSSMFDDPNIQIPEPNLLLTAGMWDTPKQLSTRDRITPHSLAFENINEDKSSIWMVSNQKVRFEPITSKLNSVAHLQGTKEYTGAQIFINSDRVILNSKKNEISLFSNREINLSSIGDITLNTEGNVSIQSHKSDVKIKAKNRLTLNANEILINSKNIVYDTSGDYAISGKRIFIGKYGDNSQPMVLGSNLALWLRALLIQLLAPGTFVSPVGPVVINPVVAAVLREMRDGLVIPSAAMFNSNDNFVSEDNS